MGAPCSGQADTARGIPFAAATDTQNITPTRVQRQHHETADDYLRTVVRLNQTWRVIECKDGLQWILQRRDAVRSGQPRWTGRRYFQTKAALLKISRALCGPLDAEALDILMALPAQIGGAA